MTDTPNEQTTKTDTQGKEANKDVKDDKKDISELDKLKADNVEFEKELIKRRELTAEAQKLEANKMLGGTSGGNVEEEVKDPDQEMADKLLADSE